MALNGYFGKPGSGKSYSVVEFVVIPALKKGRHVVTNIPLEGELLEQVYGGKVTQLPLDALDDPALPETIPHGAVAVIDECWRRWPSGQKVSNCAKNDLQWLKEHRHRVDSAGNAMQVVLVTQSPSDLASWVRQLIAHSFHMYKLEEVGSKGRFGIKVYAGCPTGDRIPKKSQIRQAYGTYKAEIYQYYKSATQSESIGSDVGDEVAMDKRTSIWGSGEMILIMLAVPLMFLLGGYLLYGYISPKLAKAEVVQEQPISLVNPMPEILPAALSEPAKAAIEIVSAPVNPGVPPPSGMWRLAGTLDRAKNARPDPPGWPSRVGYNVASEDIQQLSSKMHAVAILVGLSGVRYFPLDRCHAYEDGINYFCDVDGERVTPWSGKQALTDNFQKSAGAAPEPARTERSEARSGQVPTQATTSPDNRLTVVADNSRLPRTLRTTQEEHP
jgi:zona occludens toxin